MTCVIQPIGLSTSWNGPGASADRVLDEARSLGFQRVEAYAHFSDAGLRSLAERAAARDMHIGSLHGPCPQPMPGIGDWLASTNPSERQRAVDAHKRTIDAAVDVGAKAVVIHLGNAGVPSRQPAMLDRIARFGRLSPEHLSLRDEALAERARSIGPHLEVALESIRALGQHALSTSVRLGVEIRDGYFEIPSYDEIADVLAACDGLPVGYWHDAGHGAKQEYLAVAVHEDFLRRYGGRLVGMHIHDTHLGRDHLGPGMGETDFAMLASYLTDPTVIRTLELHRVVTAEQITAGLAVLEPHAAFGVREGILIEL